MSCSRFARQGHRWVSLVFMATVVANVAALALGGTPPPVVTCLPLLPLLLLMFSGMYLFVLPYATWWRNGRHAE